ncbi:hypothetical protein [Fusobacterium sp.]|nr:hypothetical protein [Fusobacterium sp.]
MESGIRIICSRCSGEVKVLLKKQDFIFKPKTYGVDLYKIFQQSENEAS